MMTRILVLLGVFTLVSGCALRPRYGSYVTASTPGPTVTLVVRNPATGEPIKGARVELSEGRTRLVTTSGDDGTFTLPVERTYLSENPMLVITLPPGVSGYELAPVTAAEENTGA